WLFNGNNLTDGGTVSGASTDNLFISSVSASNAGNYSCLVSGSCGTELSATATLIVNQPVTISIQPQNQEICAGQNTYFSVTAAGTINSYQWQKDGVAISGATGSTLLLNNITSADAGKYSCVITGAGDCAAITSTEATLTIDAPVAITTQPSSVTKCEGTNASFTVVASGTNLTYQWSKDGVAMTDNNRISGSVSNTLVINNIVAADKAAYTCLVTGSCENINSTPANLTVDPKTTVITQPVDFYAVVSGNATFSVTTSGASSYQWQKDGTNLTDGGGYSGVSTSILSLNNITTAEAGSYRCVVTGSCGTVNSNAAYLTVGSTKIVITQPVSPIMKCTGESANFDVVAQGTNLTYQWQRDGENLNDDAQITGSHTAGLSISNLTTSNSGNYSCLVSAKEGKENSLHSILTVNDLPDVTVQPQDAARCEGDQVVFAIQAKGSSLTYQWVKRVNTTDLNLTDGGTISGSTTAKLTVSKVALSDAAVYYCHITGDCGTDNSNPASLTVNANTKITVQPVSQTECAGASAVFGVSAVGSNLNYQWKKDGIAISDGTDVLGSTTATLTLSKLTPGAA
ncbi:MAG: immunoglobulin domain-containing protein, partial [Bacteroidota bacterium]|nr:immunoglobulin domain-containing protein [Bacteroidota bacterium]